MNGEATLPFKILRTADADAEVASDLLPCLQPFPFVRLSCHDFIVYINLTLRTLRIFALCEEGAVDYSCKGELFSCAPCFVATGSLISL